MIELISLFDYLGYAAGKALGGSVKSYAELRKAKWGVRKISNPTYKGNVMLYERQFIDEYFAAKRIFEIPVTSYELDTVNNQLLEDAFRTSDLDLIF